MKKSKIVIYDIVAILIYFIIIAIILCSNFSFNEKIITISFNILGLLFFSFDFLLNVISCIIEKAEAKIEAKIDSLYYKVK